MFEWMSRVAKTPVHVSPKKFWSIIMFSVLLMVGAMAFVWPNVKTVKMAYEYQSLAKEKQRLLKENNLLVVERESLKSLDRILFLAKKHTDLAPPEEGQILTVFLN
jgi:cell division protein FtsL